MEDKNSELIKQIFLKYKGLMFKIAFDILDNKEDSEDALQCTAEKLLAKPELFSDLESEKTKRVIITITRNTAIDFYRKRNIYQKREVRLEDAIDLPCTEMNIPYEKEAYIALNELPKSYRDILFLKYSSGYKLSEIADILDITEQNARKRISRARKHLEEFLRKGCILILCMLFLVLTGIVVDAATNGKLYTAIKDFFGSAKITDENRDLIGEEDIYELSEPQREGTKEDTSKTLEESCFIGSKIVNSATEGTPIPVSITDIKVEDGNTSEIIMSSSTSAVLYQNDYNGWECSPGDILNFNFSKYAANDKNYQTLYIGYVINGVMQEGTMFDESDGNYQIETKKEGEYYIYLYSISSDYQTLKSGKISIIKKQWRKTQ